MTDDLSRREFLDRVGVASFIAALPEAMPPKAAGPVDPGDWDLSWVKLLQGASDRAVVDAPGAIVTAKHTNAQAKARELIMIFVNFVFIVLFLSV